VPERFAVADVSRYEDLIAWQLAHELQREIFVITATGPASKDFGFRDQIRDSSSSVARNIAEGFGRYRPAEFARFLDIARGSLTETHNSLRDGHDRGYFTAVDTERMQLLAGRAAKAITGLIRYLRTCVNRNASARSPRTPRTS
jgi:four helix bundle protein